MRLRSMFTFYGKTAGVLAVVVLGVATAPVYADSASTEAILRECAQTGVIADGHTPAELREAVANMPADAAEYSPCAEEIEIALARALATPTPKAKPNGGGAGSAISRGLQTPGVRVSPEELAAALASDPDATTPADLDPTALESGGGEANAGAAADAEFSSRAEPEAGDPAAKAVGNAVAAATVGASLLALARPAMLRRRRLDDDA